MSLFCRAMVRGIRSAKSDVKCEMQHGRHLEVSQQKVAAAPAPRYHILHI